MREEHPLTDFETANHYKTLYEKESGSRTVSIIVFSILFLTIGLLVAKVFYT